MRRWWPGVVALVALAAIAAQAAFRMEPPGTLHTLHHDGRERSYHVVAPKNDNGKTPAPLVVALHGGGGNAANIPQMSGLHLKAEKEGFITVFPNGTGRFKRGLFTWNAGTCCGYAQQHNVDDSGFLLAMVRRLQKEYRIDDKRIYATGMSNGGMMAYRLACEHSGVFAAIAPVAGSLSVKDCRPDHPVSVLAIHGTNDRHVLYEGGVGPAALVKENRLSQMDTITFWANHNGFDATPHRERKGDVEWITFRGGPPGIAVHHLTLHGESHAWPGGHAYPGGVKPTQLVNATDEVWKFFKAHPKP